MLRGKTEKKVEYIFLPEDSNEKLEIPRNRLLPLREKVGVRRKEGDRPSQ